MINNDLPDRLVLPFEDSLNSQEIPGIEQDEHIAPLDADVGNDVDSDVYMDDEPQRLAIDASPEPQGLSTEANAFGLWRTYISKPSRDPNAERRGIALGRSERETAEMEREKAAIAADIIFPYQSLSAFWYGYLTSTITRWSYYIRDMFPKMSRSPDFITADFEECNYKKVQDKLSEPGSPWDKTSEGWIETSIPISIPEFAKKKLPLKLPLKRKRMPSDSHEAANSSAIHAVPGFHHRPIMSVLKHVLTSPESKNFHYEPYDHWWSRPGSDDPPVRVHGESYTSASWIEEHRNVQELVLPPEETDDLPRAIAALMFWSDATHVAQFGQASVWPIYMAFGNQSKYERSKPGSHALHHLAYMPCVSLGSIINEFSFAYLSFSSKRV